MEIKLILKNTSKLFSTKLFQFLTGLVKAKLNAIFLGTTGIGILSQINITNNQLSRFTLLGMNDGLVNLIASKKNDKRFKNILVNSTKSYIFLSSVLLIIIMSICVFFSESFTIFFFGDIAYIEYFYICILSLPILIINSTSFAILKSFKRIPIIAKAELFSAIFSFIIYLPAVYFFKLKGVAFVLLITIILKLYLNHNFSLKYILKDLKLSYIKIVRHGKIKINAIRELSLFAILGLTIGIYEIFTIMISRSIVINELGISSFGIYAPVKTWGAFYTGMMLPTIYTYLYPRFAELSDEKKIVSILNDTFRIISVAIIPFLFFGIAYGKIIIPFFYNNEFIEAYNYLPGHFIGILFLMWMNTFAMVFTPTGKIKTWVIFQFFIFSIDLFLVYFLIPEIGLYGWMVKFLFTPIIFTFIFFFYFRKKINFSFHNHNLLLLLYILCCSFVLIYFSNKYEIINYFLAVIFLISSIFFLQKNEIEFIKDKFNKIILKWKD